MSTLTMKSQARMLAKHITTVTGVPFSHSQALEALAASQGEKNYNMLATKNVPSSEKTQKSPDLTAQAHLALAIEKGLAVGAALTAFAEKQGPLERLYLQHAQSQLTSEGDLEFDDNGIVSLSEDGGAYVQGWSWVGASSLPPPESVLEAFQRGFGELTLTLHDGTDIELDCGLEVDVNGDVAAQLVTEKLLPDDTVVVSILSREGTFTLTKEMLAQFEWNDDAEAFVRSLQKNAADDVIARLSFS